MTTRCKFKCLSVKKTVGYDCEAGKNVFNYEAVLSAVQADSPENKLFFASTPVGELRVALVRQDFFVPGESYYLDISKNPPYLSMEG